MIQIVIKIGEITTLSVSGWTVTPDDRQTQLETPNGIAVQDFGHVEEGDTISCTVTIRPEGAFKLYFYWNNRSRVDVVDEAGKVWKNLRVVVKNPAPVEHFPDYYTVELEFWRV